MAIEDEIEKTANAVSQITVLEARRRASSMPGGSKNVKALLEATVEKLQVQIAKWR